MTPAPVDRSLSMSFCPKSLSRQASRKFPLFSTLLWKSLLLALLLLPWYHTTPTTPSLASASLYATEFELKLGAHLDTTLGITFDRQTNDTPSDKPLERATIFSPPGTLATSLELTDLVVPLDFLYYMNFIFIVQPTHHVQLSWKLAFENRLGSRLAAPNVMETVLTTQNWGERALKNTLALSYLAQPIPYFWLTPYAQYNVLATTHDDVFALAKSQFTYHQYRFGLAVGYHEKQELFSSPPTSLAPSAIPTLAGWNTHLNFAYEDTYFINNDYTLANVSLLPASVFDPTSREVTRLPQAGTYENLLNQRDLKTDFTLSWQNAPVTISLGYLADWKFVPNDLTLAPNQPNGLFNAARAFYSLQKAYLKLKLRLSERENSSTDQLVAYAAPAAQGYPNKYWVDLLFAYRFSAALYPPNSFTIAYENAPTSFETVNPQATFSVDDHALALYNNRDQHKHIHQLALQPKINFLPNFSWKLHYAWTVIDYQYYEPINGKDRAFITGSAKARLDQLHALRLAFISLSRSGVQSIEPYFDLNYILSNDRLPTYFRQIYAVGLKISYHF